MPDRTRWADLPRRVGTFVVAAPAVLLLVLMTSRAVFLVLATTAAGIAAGEAVVLTGRRGGGRSSRFRAVLHVLAACLLWLVLTARLHAAPDGRAWVVLMLAVTWGGDAGGYLAGRAWGRHALWPSVSPRKTREGALGSLVLALALAACVQATLLADRALPGLLGVAAVGNLLGQAGDLLESAFKRHHGAKDSGTCLPGHGGMLDCLDGLVLCAPWFVWIQSIGG